MALVRPTRGEVLRPGGLAAAAGGLEWLNLSQWIAENSPGDPVLDPYSGAATLTSAEAGTEVGVPNTAVRDGASEGVAWNLGRVSDIVPGFADDGRTAIQVYGVVVAQPPDNVNYWQGVSFCHAATGTSNAQSAVAIRRPVSVTFPAAVAGTTADVLSTDTSSGGVRGHFATAGNGSFSGAYVTGDALGTAQVAVETTADYFLRLVGGCADSANTGVHKATVQWWIAAVPTLPDGL